MTIATKGTMLSMPVLLLALLTGTAVTARAQYGQPQGPPNGGYQGGGDRGGGWDAPPQEFQEVQRQGFHDGIEGARRDFENHRRPNVNNRDEYRHPQFRGPDRHAYREGFRRGYDMGVQHMSQGGPGPRPY